MPSFIPRRRASLVLSGLLALCGVLALAACREEPASTLVEAPLPATSEPLYVYLPTEGSTTGGPALGDLPPAPPAPVGRVAVRDDSYAWAERAYAMDAAFYDAQPDYGFYYEETQPWAWETEDDWRLYAEPLEVGYRYYYYEPNAAYPFFVRDPDYGYGYDGGGRLVTVYDVSGRLLPQERYYEQAERAGRYRARAYALYEASRPERRHRIRDEDWSAREPRVRRSQAVWIQAAQREPDWVAYRVRHEERDLRRFEGERRRRGGDRARPERREFQAVRAHDDHRLAGQVRDERVTRVHDRDRARSRDDRGHGYWAQQEARRHDDNRRGHEMGQAREERRAHQEREHRGRAQQEARRHDDNRRGHEMGQAREERRAHQEREHRGRAQQETRRHEENRRGHEMAQGREERRAHHQEREHRGRAQHEARRHEENRRGHEMGQAREERRANGEREHRGRAQQEARRHDENRRGHEGAQGREEHKRQGGRQAKREGGEQHQGRSEQARESKGNGGKQRDRNG